MQYYNIAIGIGALLVTDTDTSTDSLRPALTPPERENKALSTPSTQGGCTIPKYCKVDSSKQSIFMEVLFEDTDQHGFQLRESSFV